MKYLIPLSSDLPYQVNDEKSEIILTVSQTCITCISFCPLVVFIYLFIYLFIFPLVVFNILFLLLAFNSLVMMCFTVVLFTFILLGFFDFQSFIKIGKYVIMMSSNSFAFSCLSPLLLYCS